MGPVLAKPEDAPQLEVTSIVTHMQTLTFSTPTLDMASHMRPLYITAEVEGIMVNKVMVDTGAAINVVTTRTRYPTLGDPNHVPDSQELHRTSL